MRHFFIIAACLGIITLLACSAPTSGEDQVDAGDHADVAEDADDGDTPVPAAGEAGDPCRTPGDCRDAMACVNTPSKGFVCMVVCAESPFCDDGSLCLTAASTTTSVCYVGGHRAVGESCETTLDCVVGARCLAHPTTPDLAYCYRACSADSPLCRPHEFCLEGNPRGVCLSRLGKACTGDDDCPFDDYSTCLGDDEIDETDETDETAPLQRFPEGYCSVEGCTADADCPDGFCRALEPNVPRVCLRSCDFPSDCRFYHGYDCLGAEVCDATVDPGGCRAFFGSRRLCLAALPSFDL